MSVKIESLENGHIALVEFRAPFTVAEIVATFPQSQAIFDAAVGHKVHTLLDLTYVNTVPKDVLRVRITPHIAHRNSGQWAILNANGLAMTMIDAMFRFMRFNRARYFTSYDEGLQYLRELVAHEGTILSPSHSITARSQID